ncbi:odorant receptor coreceptor-like [Polistes fuscatus]|uniref:odorant receptor coreceptor-like n=1 Tax=Polistes fuscatus TaxID=30207 RepID=UPI001CAA11CE|nr:odorant receptor coreceptor-like [Polistes fuscatus]
MVASGYIGTDCLLASSGFHLTGQLAILNCRVKKFWNIPMVLNEELKNDSAASSFNKVILADILEDSFIIIIFLQLLGTTIQLCISSYQMLSVQSSNCRRNWYTNLVIYVCVLSSTLFTYCYIGECLIEESTNLCEELYYCKWYKLSTIDSKLICICMMRARKPLRLTSAKFCIVSLRTFTDVMKTSMAYLSVLRTFK